MKKPSPAHRFKNNTLALYDIVRDIVSDNSDIDPLILDLAGAIVEGRDEKVMVNNFLDHTYDHWDQIWDKEVAYFSEFALNALRRANERNQKSVVGGIGVSHIEKIKHIIEDPSLVNEETQEEIFKIMYGLVKISLQYVYETRQTSLSYASHVDLKKEVERWNVKNLKDKV